MNRFDCTRSCEHNALASLLMINHGFISANNNQDLSEVQKEQARDNIDAVSTDKLDRTVEEIAETYATKNELAQEKAELEDAIDNIPQPDLTPYATKEDLSKKADAPSNGEQYALVSQLPDISPLATKQELTNAISDLINGADADSDTIKELAEQLKRLAEVDAGLATKESVSELADKVEAIEIPDVSGFATKTELTKAIQDLINGADADSDTLKELADKITALAQADNGLVSAAEAQGFTVEQQKQARDNIDAVSLGELNQVVSDIADTYSTKDELSQAIDNIPDPDFSPYATKSEVEDKYATKEDLPDLAPYATKTDLSDGLASKADAPDEGEEYALVSQVPDISNLATKAGLSGLEQRLDNIEVLGGYVSAYEQASQ